MKRQPAHLFRSYKSEPHATVGPFGAVRTFPCSDLCACILNRVGADSWTSSMGSTSSDASMTVLGLFSVFFFGFVRSLGGTHFRKITIARRCDRAQRSRSRISRLPLSLKAAESILYTRIACGPRGEAQAESEPGYDVVTSRSPESFVL